MNHLSELKTFSAELLRNYILGQTFTFWDYNESPLVTERLERKQNVISN